MKNGVLPIAVSFVLLCLLLIWEQVLKICESDCFFLLKRLVFREKGGIFAIEWI